MKKYLARNHKFYIFNESEWIPISGISQWAVSYEKSSSDLSKFNENGWTSSIISSRFASIDLNGFYLVDSVTGERDKGQKLCESAATGLGYHGLRLFKIEAFEDSNEVIGSIQASGVVSIPNRGGTVSSSLPWNSLIKLKGIPTGSGIYNIFDQESYPPPASGIDRAGMWTGVLGMYTYTE